MKPINFSKTLNKYKVKQKIANDHENGDDDNFIDTADNNNDISSDSTI